jgi:hypothetical protein
MKRMLSFVTGQRLPNFIPLNEPKTRPDAVHFLYTPESRAIKRCWEDLQATLHAALPGVQIEPPVAITDEYDGAEICKVCTDLLQRYPQDDWSLNATGGTKLMSGPAMELFFRRGLPVYYIETRGRRTLQVHPDWSVEETPFESTLDLSTYFALYGVNVSPGSPRNRQEEHVFRQLSLLNWRVWPSVELRHNGMLLAEFDAIGIDHYQLSVVECKRLSGARPGTSDEVLHDLFKLYQVRQHFGGPFGRSYWVFTGGYTLPKVTEDRIREFDITLIRSNEINQLSASSKSFGLPDRA